MSDKSRTPLAEKLIARIRLDGPMTVADYMAACLGDSQHGYYLRQEPFGRGGDFVTAPEISQMFGELVGLWAVSVWEAMGSPPRFVLAELGPGRGTLMADALRAARIRPACVAAADLRLVETSPRLREAQRAALANSGTAASWHDGLDALPAGPLVLIANEFFDALPIRQFHRVGEGWAERMVGLSDSGDLAFGLRPTAESAHFLGEPVASASPAVIVELSPMATAIMAKVASRLVRDGGAALIIDYGYLGPAHGDTLQAVRRHAYDDPLAHPGEADITAHVDFAALAAAAARAGAVVHGPVGQGDFLRGLGLDVRAQTLARNKDEATRAAVAAAANRLASPDAMGTLFQAMAVSAPGLAVPGFDSVPVTPESPAL